MLFQYGGQRRELRRFQLRKVLPVPKHQIAAGDTPGGELFLRDLSVALCHLGQIFQILLVLRLFRQKGELMEKSVQMHLVIDMVFISLAVDHISCPILSLSAFPIVGNLAGLCREKSV